MIYKSRFVSTNMVLQYLKQFRKNRLKQSEISYKETHGIWMFLMRNRLETNNQGFINTQKYTSLFLITGSTYMFGHIYL